MLGRINTVRISGGLLELFLELAEVLLERFLVIELLLECPWVPADTSLDELAATVERWAHESRGSPTRSLHVIELVEHMPR